MFYVEFKNGWTKNKYVCENLWFVDGNVILVSGIKKKKNSRFINKENRVTIPYKYLIKVKDLSINDYFNDSKWWNKESI